MKALHLQQIREYLYRQSPRGVSSADMARILGLSRSGALKNLRSASELWPEIYQDEENRLWYFQSSSRLLEVSLTPGEARILHLATRLFARLMPRRLPESSSALHKLAEAAGSASAASAALMEESAEEMEERFRPVDSAYQGHLNRIYLALEEGHPLTLHYLRKNGEEAHFRILPLFFEPYGEGRSLYLCGRDLDKPRFLTLKTEHILEVRMASFLGKEGLFSQEERAALRRELRQLLADSWGIWSGTGKRERVVLRFSEEVAGRVGETLWHPAQRLKKETNGLLWEAEISSPLEMYPWIRSWGQAVEVLEPQWLRERIRQDAEENYRKYL